MFEYLLVFLIASLFAVISMSPIPSNLRSIEHHWGPYWVVTYFILSLFIGYRHEVGADWFSYGVHLDNANGEEIFSVIKNGDPAYMVLNWFGANVFGGIYFVNLVCAGIFSFGLIEFCRFQSRPRLSLVVAIPYLITVVAMGYTRQGVAIGLAMLGLVALMRGNSFRFIFWIAAAATFHKSALILIPIAIFSGQKNRIATIIGVAVVGVFLFVLLLQEAIERLNSIYIDQEYESSGAWIRVLMNAMPAIIFLFFRRRFKLPYDIQIFWSWISVFAILFFPLLYISPSSTAVDRLALYFIPIQLFVWSRLPDAFGSFGKRNPVLYSAVILYNGLVLIVWLLFANNARSWIPYQWYPWIFLFS